MARPHPFTGLAALWSSPQTAPPLVHGQLRARIMALALPSALIEPLLPTGIELAPQRLCASGTHPLIISLGHYSDVHLALERRDSGAVLWDECRIAVPWVRRALGPRPRPGQLRDLPLSVTLLQHVDHVVSLVGGQLWSGDRQLARFDLGPHRAAVRSPLRDRPLLHAQFADSEAPIPRPLREALHLRWLARQATGDLKRFAYHWQPAELRLRPLVAQLDLGAGLLDGLPTGPAAVLAALELSGSWSLDVPEDLPDPAQDYAHLRRAHRLADIDGLARQWAASQPQVAELAQFWQRMVQELQQNGASPPVHDPARLSRLVIDWFNCCHDAADAWARGWWPGQTWQLALDGLPGTGLGPLLHAAVQADLPRVAADHVMASHLTEFTSDYSYLTAMALAAGKHVSRLDHWFAAAWPEIVTLAPLSPEHRIDAVERLDRQAALSLDAENLDMD